MKATTLEVLVIISKIVCVIATIGSIVMAIHEKDAGETFAWIIVLMWAIKDITIEYLEKKQHAL